MRAATEAMPEVPKIVHEKLRAGLARGVHPDANLLAAFAEQALAGDERESVLEHLARCQECRELLAVSLPLEAAPAAERAAETFPTDPALIMPQGKRRSWFAWNRLGWAGLAAGLAIAASVLIVHPGSRNKTEEALKSTPAAMPSKVKEVQQENKPAPAASSEVSQPPSELAKVGGEQLLVSPIPMRRDAAKERGFMATAPKAVAPSSVLADKLEASAGKKDEQPRPPASVSETAEVSGGAVAVAAEPAQSTDALARNEASPVFRAKAARAMDSAGANLVADVKQKGTEEKSLEPSMGYVVNGAAAPVATAKSAMMQKSMVQALWAIRGDAVLRSLDAGAHWESVFQPHRPLLFATGVGADVWVGGKNGELFHSTDMGATWNSVHPSVGGQALAGDITRIDVYSSSQVVLSTSKKESWSTSDGGKTWEKR